jgi:hypothetical protein
MLVAVVLVCRWSPAIKEAQRESEMWDGNMKRYSSMNRVYRHVWSQVSHQGDYHA